MPLCRERKRNCESPVGFNWGSFNKRGGNLSNVAFVTTGIEAIDRRLMSLEPKLQKKVIRKAQRDGAKDVLAAAKSLAPVKSGALKKNLKIRTIKRKKGQVGLDIGTAAKDFTGDQFYSSFLIYGTKKIPKGKHDFLTPAYEQTNDKVRNKIIDQIQMGIETEANAR